jgi:diguanylate cyclase
MSLMIYDWLYGFSMAILGAVAAWWLCWTYFHRKTHDAGNAEARHAADVLVHLQELASRVAVDVDKHSSRVEEINNELTSADNHQSANIVDAVAKLIQANQQMQKKLVSTENKLRKQAREIQIHAAEARTDALTLLANRRAFDDELARRVAEFRRLGRTFSLIMADVDQFKEFNDAHGHPAGDEVLQGVAKLLRRTMREMDLVARYGGEEYAMILPGTVLGDACRAAIRAREAIEKSHFQHDAKGDLQVTVSFGVAELLNNEDEATLVKRADKALYTSKEGGRNCVYWHDGKTIQRVGSRKDPLLPEQKQELEQVTDESKKSPVSTVAAVVKPPESISDPNPPLEQEAMPEMPSRTNFCQQVRNRMAEWKRGGPTFSVVLIEVNQFNQCQGQNNLPSRELATMMVTKFLTSTLREMDYVGHYAPGCFSLLLPTAGLVDAIRVAERLREGFSQFSLTAQGEQPKYTLSVGVVQIMDTDETVSLMKRAEAALDAADRRGGNRVYYHDGKRCAPVTAMLETMDYLS